MGSFDISEKYITDVYKEIAGETIVRSLREKISDRDIAKRFLERFCGESMNDDGIRKAMEEYLSDEVYPLLN